MPPVSTSLLQVLLFEYDVQTRDRRLYAQSMMVAMGFTVAAFAALAAAWVQSGNPTVLVIIAPLMLLGGSVVLLLRVALLRVSVYLTLVEQEIRAVLQTEGRPIAWETSMTGRIGPVAETTSPGRGAPGLSVQATLAFGIGIALVAMVAGYAALGSPQAQTLLAWLPGDHRWYQVIYIAINLAILAALVAVWEWQVPSLESAKGKFARVRAGEALEDDEPPPATPRLWSIRSQNVVVRGFRDPDVGLLRLAVVPGVVAVRQLGVARLRVPSGCGRVTCRTFLGRG
jgi:hypothetical protein